MNGKSNAEFHFGKNERQMSSTDELQYMVTEVRTGNIDAAVKFLQRFHGIVFSVAFDVLQDEQLARESAWESLLNAIAQLKQGVCVDKLELWLLELCCNDALRFDKSEPPPLFSETQSVVSSDMKVEEPADVASAKTRGIFSSDLHADPIENQNMRDGPILRPLPEKKAFQPHRCQSVESNLPLGCGEIGKRNSAFFIETGRDGKAPDKKDCTATSPPKRRIRPGAVALTVALALLCLLCLWVIAGLISKNFGGGFPDLGYAWFNRKQFSLF